MTPKAAHDQRDALQLVDVRETDELVVATFPDAITSRWTRSPAVSASSTAPPPSRSSAAAATAAPTAPSTSTKPASPPTTSTEACGSRSATACRSRPDRSSHSMTAAYPYQHEYRAGPQSTSSRRPARANRSHLVSDGDVAGHTRPASADEGERCPRTSLPVSTPPPCCAGPLSPAPRSSSTSVHRPSSRLRT